MPTIQTIPSSQSRIRLFPPGVTHRKWLKIGLMCLCLLVVGEASASDQRPTENDARPTKPLFPTTTTDPIDQSRTIFAFQREPPSTTEPTWDDKYSASPRLTDPPPPEQIEQIEPIQPIRDSHLIGASTNSNTAISSKRNPTVTDSAQPDSMKRTTGQRLTSGQENQRATMELSTPDPRRLVFSSKGVGAGKRLQNDSAQKTSTKGLLSYLTPTTGNMQTTGAALAIVVGLLCICAWFFRRSVPRSTSPLPQEAVRALGRTQLAPRQFIQLLQVGNKLVLVSVTSERTDPITEVTEPAEVDRILGLCMRDHSASTTAEFQQVLNQLSREPASGFLGNEGPLENMGRNRS